VEVRADCEHASLRASIGGRALVQIGKKRAERTGLRVDIASGGLAWLERGLRRRTLARNPREAGMRATGVLVEGIAAALQEGREPPSSGREAREVLEVIDAAYRSAEEGRRIELEPAGLTSALGHD
jgi:predicted dehydrogenase